MTFCEHINLEQIKSDMKIWDPSGSTGWETAKKVTSQIFLILNIFVDWGLQSAKNALLWWFYICEWIRAITG
jgi:hypothetical protein